MEIQELKDKLAKLSEIKLVLERQRAINELEITESKQKIDSLEGKLVPIQYQAGQWPAGGYADRDGWNPIQSHSD